MDRIEGRHHARGREEHADIALFRDMKVEKKHCYIKRVQERYVLVNNGAPPQQTLVNDAPVADSLELQDGDRIQLGNVLLRFQLRAAHNRAKPRRATLTIPPPPPPGAIPQGPPPTPPTSTGIIVPPRRPR